jgi:GDP-L-fucose synthase
MKNKILVIGGYGFLGKNIQKVFPKENIFFEGPNTGLDLLDYEKSLNKIKEIDPDIIINAAAKVGSVHYVSSHAADVIDVNTRMLLNLYLIVLNVNTHIKIINPLPNCTYPSEVHNQDEEKWWNGPLHDSVDSYASARRMGFTLSKCYEKQHKIKTVNLILPNAYGCYDHTDPEKTHAMNGIIIRMIKSMDAGDDEFSIWGTGAPIREWVYMEDVAKIIKIIIDNEMYELPSPINIGQNCGISIMDSATICKNILKYDVSFTNDLTKQDGTPIKILGNKLFKKYFTDFEFTEYEKGIKNTIKYYKRLI